MLEEVSYLMSKPKSTIGTINKELTEAHAHADALLEKIPILVNKLKLISTDEEVDPKMLFREVIKFLYLVKTYEMTLTPSLLVDLGWHEFILFTKSYERFCLTELGRFIHHEPDEDKSTNHRRYLKTIQCYIKTYGKPAPEIWGDLATSEWEDSQCGSCSTN